MDGAQDAVAVYVHIPFCGHRCGYCNFSVVADRDAWVPRFLRALARELEMFTGAGPVRTIYFGGGTPSRLPLPALEELRRLLERRFDLGGVQEWTLEANPEDVTRSACSMWGDLGITRVSLGVQSLHDAKLERLDRHHDARRASEGVRVCRESGFDVAVDLIFGLKDESLAGWRDELNQVLRLQPHHVSVYELVLERGSRWYGPQRGGQLEVVSEDPERLRAFYLAARHTLQNGGFEHYEIANFARPGRRCRHNETYWTGKPYVGFGPGAASLLGRTRRSNHGGVLGWMRRLESGASPVVLTETLGPPAFAREQLVLGLRRLEGVDPERFQKQFGYSVDALAGPTLRWFAQEGWVEWTGKRWRLTEEGILVSDGLWRYVLRPDAPVAADSLGGSSRMLSINRTGPT